MMLEVRDLTVHFGRRATPAVCGVDLTLDPGERLGLIGESGSGKSVTSLAIMGLLGDTARITGSIRWNGVELLGSSDAAYSTLRGKAMGMVFQEPMTALDPTMRCGRQVAEVVRLHAGADAGQARARVIEMLARVGLSEPERVADSFPHQLSGGQRQRVLIAMAMVNGPDLLIADEPTTALDVTVQATVLAELDRMLESTGAGLLFISHDLAVVARMCQRIAVMYRGRILEVGDLDQILHNPTHPYTAGLVATADIGSAAPGSRLPVLQDFWEQS